jgi:hypothetical protein
MVLANHHYQHHQMVYHLACLFSFGFVELYAVRHSPMASTVAALGGAQEARPAEMSSGEAAFLHASNRLLWRSGLNVASSSRFLQLQTWQRCRDILWRRRSGESNIAGFVRLAASGASGSDLPGPLITCST